MPLESQGLSGFLLPCRLLVGREWWYIAAREHSYGHTLTLERLEDERLPLVYKAPCEAIQSTSSWRSPSSSTFEHHGLGRSMSDLIMGMGASCSIARNSLSWVTWNTSKWPGGIYECASTCRCESLPFVR